MNFYPESAKLRFPLLNTFSFYSDKRGEIENMKRGLRKGLHSLLSKIVGVLFGRFGAVRRGAGVGALFVEFALESFDRALGFFERFSEKAHVSRPFRARVLRGTPSPLCLSCGR